MAVGGVPGHAGHGSSRTASSRHLIWGCWGPKILLYYYIVSDGPWALAVRGWHGARVRGTYCKARMPSRWPFTVTPTSASSLLDTSPPPTRARLSEHRQARVHARSRSNTRPQGKPEAPNSPASDGLAREVAAARSGPYTACRSAPQRLRHLGRPCGGAAAGRARAQSHAPGVQ